MQISEIKKIVNDGLNKYKAFKEADTALTELLSLEQAKVDLTKTVLDLEKAVAKERNNLSENKLAADAAKAEAKDILDNANLQAAKVVAAATVKAEGIVASAEDRRKTVDAIIDQSNEKLAAAIKARADADAAKAEADKEQARLDKIKKELGALLNVGG